MSTTEEQLLSVTDLQIAYGAEPAVSGVSFTVGRGEVVAVVGESGSGKSTTAHAILGLLAGSGHVTGGTVEFEGEQIDSYSDRAWQRIRGARIGLVPQDPTTSLNPVTRIGDQVAEVLRIHGLADRRKARLDAVEVLERAGAGDGAVLGGLPDDQQRGAARLGDAAEDLGDLDDLRDAAGALVLAQAASRKAPKFADPLELWGEALLAQDNAKLDDLFLRLKTAE